MASGVVILVVAVGICLRLYPVFKNRSLWLDEALLANMIVKRDFAGLADGVNAPYGFLCVEKIVGMIFGMKDFVLRWFPCFAGLASVVSFAWIAWKSLSGIAAIWAVVFISFSPVLAYYTWELKQYSLDVLCSIAVIALALRFKNGLCSRRDAVFVGGVGAILAWFSHPFVFSLFGLGCLLFFAASKNSAAKWSYVFGCIVAWGISFVLNYFLCLRSVSKMPAMQQYWNGGFMPWPPQWSWFESTLFGGIDYFGITGWHVPALSLILLCAVIWKIDRNFLLAFGAVCCGLLAASVTHNYAVAGRLIMFLFPWVAMLGGYAVDAISRIAFRSYPSLGLVMAALSFVILLFPVYRTIQQCRAPAGEDIKPLMAVIQIERKPGDAIYVYHNSKPAFSFYADKFAMANFHAGVPPDSKMFSENIAALSVTNKLWAIFTHVENSAVGDEEKFVVAALSKKFHQQRKWERKEADLYLFEPAAGKAGTM